MDIKNIFSDIQKHAPDEILENILQTDQFKIERIISRGHATANESGMIKTRTNGLWY